MKFVTLLILACVCLLSACSSKTVEDNQQERSAETSESFQAREVKPYLSQKQAKIRSERVSEVNYKLDFTLTGGEKFTNKSEISFYLSDASQALTLDLNKADIKSILVNGKAVKADYNQWFITLNEKWLKTGQNKVVVEFSRLHSTNGEGLHRFVDPVDSKVYLYSHFEPAGANQMFAVFDQPDLKASYQLTVTAPKDWMVISATKENRIVATEPTATEQSNTWYFPATKKLSPYNFSMHAGPYHQWSDNSQKYPMRLFARQSIASKIHSEDWFKYTAAGLEFFDDYFGIGYPFKKYDQVIVPDFLYGAMENAAAITFSERAFVTSGEMTSAQKQRLAGVIMHEMAHQWFGDLVTMKWWNGLWLNESFASFMGTLATAESTEFDYAWRSFYAQNKQGAYRQDQRVTTHPIEVAVPTTSNAFDNIDAITYSKGASTLMQLRHLLGTGVFRKGVQQYLKKYSYRNAELSDFIGSLAQVAGRSLDDWKTQWLYQAGVNSINVDIRCNENKISQLTLEQRADENYPFLREQKVQVGLFALKEGKLDLSQAFPVIYKGTSTEVKAAVGFTCPDLVYPNYQDWGFVKVNLDQASFQTAKDHLSGVTDPLLRSMLWQSLWDSVRDGDLKLNDYLNVAINNVTKETDYTILGQALGSIAGATNYLKLIGNKANTYRNKIQHKMELLYWEKANDNQQESRFQKRWFSSYIVRSETKEALSKLKQLLDGEIKIKGITLNQDYRWDIIYQLNRYNFSDSLILIEQELLTDQGDSAQKRALAAKVVRPDAEQKNKWLSKIHALKSPLPFSKTRIIMSNLYRSEQTDLIELTAQQILTKLEGLDKEKGPVFMRGYANRMLPATCNGSSVKRLEKTITELKNLSNLTLRALLEAHQEDEICVMIKNKLLATNKQEIE